MVVFLKKWIKILGILVIVFVAVIGLGILSFDRPKLQEVNNEWGEVDQKKTEIRSSIYINNPNPIGIPFASIEIKGEILMNNVVMGAMNKSDVDIEAGNNNIELVSNIHNDKIPEWFVSHVDSGEYTDIRISPEVTLKTFLTDFGIQMPDQTSSLQTSFLSGFTEIQKDKITDPATDKVLLTIENVEAEWGEVTEEKSQINAEVTVENPNPFPINLNQLSYQIDLNGIDIGSNETTEKIILGPNQETKVKTSLLIKNDKLEDWWPIHIKNNEESQLSINMKAIVEFQNQELEIPIYESDQTIETDILGIE